MVTAALHLADMQLEQRERLVGARWTHPLQRRQSLGGRMSRAGGTRQSGGVCPGGTQPGWEVGPALPPRGEGLCRTWLLRGPLPENDALTQPRLSFGSGLEDVGLFCHVLEGITVRLCRAGGRERMPGSIFREAGFFLDHDSACVSAPVQSRFRSPQT